MHSILFAAHFLEDESEENLHSFQGNEAGQDLDYEPGLEFDDTELAKAAIELAASVNSHAQADTFSTSFYLNGDGDMGDAPVSGNEVIDCSLILDDNPLFSLDSQYDSDDEKTKCEAVKDDLAGEGSHRSSPSPSEDSPSSAEGPVPRPNLENLVPRTVEGSEVLPVGLDVSAIYLQSPDELLEENFEEALREQYSSLPPLDPALDLTLSGGPLDPEKENFDDIAEHGIVGVAGDDMFARKVITIYACRLPSNKTFNYAKFLRSVFPLHFSKQIFISAVTWDHSHTFWLVDFQRAAHMLCTV